MRGDAALSDCVPSGDTDKRDAACAGMDDADLSTAEPCVGDASARGDAMTSGSWLDTPACGVDDAGAGLGDAVGVTASGAARVTPTGGHEGNKDDASAHGDAMTSGSRPDTPACGVDDAGAGLGDAVGVLGGEGGSAASGAAQVTPTGGHEGNKDDASPCAAQDDATAGGGMGGAGIACGTPGNPDKDDASDSGVNDAGARAAGPDDARPGVGPGGKEAASITAAVGAALALGDAEVTSAPDDATPRAPQGADTCAAAHGVPSSTRKGAAQATARGACGRHDAAGCGERVADVCGCTGAGVLETSGCEVMYSGPDDARGRRGWRGAGAACGALDVDDAAEAVVEELAGEDDEDAGAEVHEEGSAGM